MSNGQEFLNNENQGSEYTEGFVTDIETIDVPKGLSVETVKFISKQKKEPKWMLEWRLKAFERLQSMKEPDWQKPKYPKIDYQDLYYYSAPKSLQDQPKSLDEIDPEIRKTYDKLGIPLLEQKRLSGIAVDAVFDSVSVATTFKEKLGEIGVIFCSISFGSIVRSEWLVISQNIGFAPRYLITLTVAAKVKEGTRTSSPELIPKTDNAICKDAVQDAVVKA